MMVRQDSRQAVSPLQRAGGAHLRDMNLGQEDAAIETFSSRPRARSLSGGLASEIGERADSVDEARVNDSLDDERAEPEWAALREYPAHPLLPAP